MTTKTMLLTAALCLTALAGGAGAVAHAGSGGHAHGAVALAADPGPAKGEKAAAKGHDHAAPPGSGLATDQLKLNAGKKWQTDAALREGMSGIRADIEAAIKPIHAGQYTPADYEKLAKGLEGRVNKIIATCKLPPDADAQLHLVVADVFGGASVMKAEGDRSAGVVKIIKALDAYGRFFDQAGWTKIAH